MRVCCMHAAQLLLLFCRLHLLLDNDDLLYVYVLSSTVKEKRKEGRERKQRGKGREKEEVDHCVVAFVILISKGDDSNTSFLFSNR